MPPRFYFSVVRKATRAPQASANDGAHFALSLSENKAVYVEKANRVVQGEVPSFLCVFDVGGNVHQHRCVCGRAYRRSHAASNAAQIEGESSARQMKYDTCNAPNCQLRAS